MPLKTLAGLVLGPALLLLLPWVALRFTAEVAWDRADFLVAWALLFGAGLARFQPRGMARALRATALAQLLVPVVALLIRPTGLTPGVWKEIALNAGFALLFFASAWLFQRAARAGA